MGVRRYYALIASLPPLPHFATARHLPINRERLQSRLRMLHADDRELVRRLSSFLRWHHQPRERSDATIVQEYGELRRSIDGTPCARLVEDTVTQRTLVVALRRRQRGLPAPAVDEPWGLGPWVGALRRNWERPEFGLAGVFPWLGRARALLDGREALEAERFLVGLEWERLARARPLDAFRFEALLVYLFRWSVLEQWLSYAAEAAGTRFDELVMEAIGDYDQQLH
ncbi:MAG: hypothetical protein P1P84_07280 [Deferrisomatales bacterium]|nr:hypothetical protein [Deferrisomatales bacterium]